MKTQTFTIELDFSHEFSFGELLDDISPYNLTAQIVELCGPAGGNPLLSLSSTNKSDIINYLKEKYMFDCPEDVDYFADQITVS